MRVHSDNDRSSAGRAIANAGNAMHAAKGNAAGPTSGIGANGLSRVNVPILRKTPVIQLLKKEHEKKLIPLIEEITAFRELLSSLSDPLDFGLEDFYKKLASTLPGRLEAINPAIQAVLNLREETSQDPEVPISEDHILKFAGYTMDDALGPLLAEAGDLVAGLNGAVAGQQAAYDQLTRLAKKAAKVIATETGSLGNLLRKAPEEVQRKANTTRMISMGEIRPMKSTYSGSEVLNKLRLEYGIQDVRGVRMNTLTRMQSTVIFNQLLNILQSYPHPIGLEVNAIIPIPGDDAGEQILQPVRFVIAPSRVVQIAIEAGPAAVDAGRWPSIPEAQEALMKKYGITGFEEEGAQWTLVELVHLDDALQKTDTAGRTALRGIKMIRKAAGGEDSDESKEGGSYNPLLHTISLADIAFTKLAPTFVGFRANAGFPANASHASHETILHEVGHAVEYSLVYLESVRLKENVAKIESTIAQLEKESKEIGARIEQLRSEKDEATESSDKEKWEKIEGLALRIDQMTIKSRQAKAGAKGLFEAGHKVYESTFKQVPETGGREIMELLNAYLNGLGGYMLEINNFDYNGEGPAALGAVTKAFAETESAQSNWNGNSKTKDQPYSVSLHGALAALQKAADCFPEILQLNGQLIELDAEMSRTRAHFERIDAGINEKYDPGLEKLNKHREEIRGSTKELRGQGREAGNVSHEFEMSRITLKQTPTLLKFVSFVKEKDIHPITRYALKEWDRGNFSEFFAEAYHLFRNDPGFLKRSSPELFEYFASERYL